jgi:hypothetical protein
VIVWKPIRPKRLRDDLMRLTLLNAMREVGREIKRDYETLTATWEHKPRFEILISLRRGTEVLVTTDDEIYRYVSEGTEEHVILPKEAKALRFREGFVAKTKPGQLISIAGATFGKVVFAAGVIHPGTEAREFDKAMQKRWEKRFKTRIEKAMREAAKKSGHLM